MTISVDTSPVSIHRTGKHLHTHTHTRQTCFNLSQAAAEDSVTQTHKDQLC